LRTLIGISSSATSESASGSGCLSRVTGCFSDAAVDGLMSCRGEGWRLIDAPCSVEAMSPGMSDSMSLQSVYRVEAGCRRQWWSCTSEVEVNVDNLALTSDVPAQSE